LGLKVLILLSLFHSAWSCAVVCAGGGVGCAGGGGGGVAGLDVLEGGVNGFETVLAILVIALPILILPPYC
jgi:hypothetical protein